MVKTSPSQGGVTGSIPVRAIARRQSLIAGFFFTIQEVFHVAEDQIHYLNAQQLAITQPMTFHAPTPEAIKRLQVGDKVQLGFVDPEIQGEFLPVVITVIQPDGLQGRLAAAPKRLPYLRADQVVSFDWVNILKIFA